MDIKNARLSTDVHGGHTVGGETLERSVVGLDTQLTAVVGVSVELRVRAVPRLDVTDWIVPAEEGLTGDALEDHGADDPHLPVSGQVGH